MSIYTFATLLVTSGEQVEESRLRLTAHLNESNALVEKVRQLQDHNVSLQEQLRTMSQAAQENEVGPLRYVTLRYVALRYVTLRYVTLRCVTLRYVTLRYVTLFS